MVIEDDHELRDALIAFIEGLELGLLPVGAENGVEALAKLDEGPLPSLIVLDVMMPKMDGRAFRQRQLSDPRLRDIPVVVITALPVTRDPEFKGVHWIPKPFRAAELTRIVHLLLGASEPS